MDNREYGRKRAFAPSESEAVLEGTEKRRVANFFIQEEASRQMMKETGEKLLECVKSVYGVADADIVQRADETIIKIGEHNPRGLKALCSGMGLPKIEFKYDEMQEQFAKLGERLRDSYLSMCGVSAELLRNDGLSSQAVALRCYEQFGTGILGEPQALIGVDLARGEDWTVTQINGKCIGIVGCGHTGASEILKKAMEQWRESPQGRMFEEEQLRLALIEPPTMLIDSLATLMKEAEPLEDIMWTPRNRAERRGHKDTSNKSMWEAEAVPRRTTKTVKKKAHRR